MGQRGGDVHTVGAARERSRMSSPRDATPSLHARGFGIPRAVVRTFFAAPTPPANTWIGASTLAVAVLIGTASAAVGGMSWVR